MENHPIPQDVTGFQFKLIGNMTIKQFAYLGTGIALAWFFFSLQITLLIKLPLVIFFASLGFFLAFIPVEGRPLDSLIIHFVKALFIPNQFLFQKTGRPIFPIIDLPHAPISHPQPTTSQATVQAYLQTHQMQSHSKLDEKEQLFFQSLTSYTTTQKIPLKTPITHAPPVLQIDQQSIKETKPKQDTFVQAVATTPVVPYTPPPPVITRADTPPAPTPVIKQPTVTVNPTPMRKVTQAPKKAIGLVPMSDVPNLIMGLIKDTKGTTLPNILIEVKDKDENPVRAFKTNMLGQFASATPLANGTYTVEFDDPRGEHTFDPIEVTLDGKFLSPIEIIARDQREALRKALFNV